MEVDLQKQVAIADKEDHMSSSQDPQAVKEAILQKRAEARQLLFSWLASEPHMVGDYVEIACALADVSELNLTHLVLHRALANFPDDDSLALFGLHLESLSSRRAA